MADLFGFELSDTGDAIPLPRRIPLVLENPKPRGKHYVEPRGYADLPGTGPAGKTCLDCKHYTLNRMAKSYPKCGLNRARWTGGRGSDILAKAPACRRFENA